jgi:hypothetical protein
VANLVRGGFCENLIANLVPDIYGILNQTKTMKTPQV